MPLFYLHRRIDGELYLDPEGEDFPDLAAAIVDAKQSVREYLSERLKRGEPLNGDAFEIWSADDAMVAEIPFKDVLGWTS
jgi:hypothetical protein